MRILPTVLRISGGLITDTVSRRWGPSMIRDGRELFQQSRVICRKPADLFDQVGTVTARPMELLRSAPPLDSGVVTTPQHLGHFPATELRRTGELRLLEQARFAKTLGHGAHGVAHRTVAETGDRLDDQARSDLSPTEHHVTDADFAVDKVLANAMIDALVPSAQQAESTAGSEFRCDCLIERAASRAEQQ